MVNSYQLEGMFEVELVRIQSDGKPEPVGYLYADPNSGTAYVQPDSTPHA